jgi:flagellar basal body-associated protein FliL
MKSCLIILIIFFTLVAVLGGGAFLWYISSTSEFSRTGDAGKNPPKATIVAPKAVPVR